MAGAMDLMAGNLANNLGNVEKAIIELVDLRDRVVKVEDGVKVQTGSRAGLGGMKGTGFASTGMLSDYAKSMTESIVGENGGTTVKSYVDTSDLKNAKKRYYTVQFNPGSLTLTGHGGGLVQKMDYSKGNGEITYTQGDTNISLSVSLLFDSVDPADAFMDGKISASLTTMGTGVAKSVLSAMGKKKNSVQTEVEAFVAAIRNKYTRLITFHWGDFAYSGVLKSVNVTYTMFNVTGDPVRAKVDLSIMCADNDSPNSFSWWQDKYMQAFGTDKIAGQKGFGSESFTNASQKVGNLLNL